MQTIVIVFCFIYILYAILTKKKIYDPSVMFIGTWGMTSFMNSLNLYGIPVAKTKTYLIIFIGLCSYMLGYIFAKTNKCKEFEINFFRRNRFIIMSGICFIILLNPFFKAFRLVLSGTSLYDIRYTYYSQIIDGGINGILYNYYAQPFLTVMIVISLNKFFSKEKNFKYLIFTIICIIMNTIIGGGRFLLLYFIFSLLILILLNKEYLKEKITKKHISFKFKILLFLAILAIIVITNIRGADLIQTLYVYASGGIPFMEYLLEIQDTKYFYGLVSLNGFIRPIFVLIRFIGITSLPRAIENAQNLLLATDLPYYLTPNILFNSFTTCFYAPYVDGGIIGEMIIMFFIGYIICKLYRKINFENEFSIELYVLVSLMLLLSFFRLLISNYTFAMTFVYLLICYSKKKYD